MQECQSEIAGVKSAQAVRLSVEKTHEAAVRAPEADLLGKMGATSANAAAHARTLNRMTNGQPTRAQQWALHLQRTQGNRHMQRVLALARQREGEGEVTPDVEAAIERSRGRGQALDTGVRRQMESAFGADFSDVRIHTGSESHSLNRAVNAIAFTTGQDIFFRDDAYNPQTSVGKELLAHELTHVVQQGGSGTLPGKLVVGEPDDCYEREAEQVAKSVAGQLSISSNPSTTTATSTGCPVRRQCACGGAIKSGGECDECRAKRGAVPGEHMNTPRPLVEGTFNRDAMVNGSLVKQGERYRAFELSDLPPTSIARQEGQCISLPEVIWKCGIRIIACAGAALAAAGAEVASGGLATAGAILLIVAACGDLGYECSAAISAYMDCNGPAALASADTSGGD